MTGPLDTKRRYRACPRLLARPDEEKVLAYDPRTMKVHCLNESLAFVFERCDGQTSCEEMALAMMQTYELDTDTAARETYRALKLLASDELIEAK